jgi:hypothetical protein
MALDSALVIAAKGGGIATNKRGCHVHDTIIMEMFATNGSIFSKRIQI